MKPSLPRAMGHTVSTSSTERMLLSLQRPCDQAVGGMLPDRQNPQFTPPAQPIPQQPSQHSRASSFSSQSASVHHTAESVHNTPSNTQQLDTATSGPVLSSAPPARPNPNDNQRKKRKRPTFFGDDRGPERKLIESHVAHQHVAAFLRQILMRVFPRQIWGSKHNWQVVCAHVHKFVRLRRHETISVHHLLQGCSALLPRVTWRR